MYSSERLSLFKSTYSLMDGWNSISYVLIILKCEHRETQVFVTYLIFLKKFNCNMLEWMFQLFWPISILIRFLIFKYVHLYIFHFQILWKIAELNKNKSRYCLQGLHFRTFKWHTSYKKYSVTEWKIRVKVKRDKRLRERE